MRIHKNNNKRNLKKKIGIYKKKNRIHKKNNQMNHQGKIYNSIKNNNQYNVLKKSFNICLKNSINSNNLKNKI